MRSATSPRVRKKLNCRSHSWCPERTGGLLGDTGEPDSRPDAEISTLRTQLAIHLNIELSFTNRCCHPKSGDNLQSTTSESMAMTFEKVGFKANAIFH